VSILLPDSLDIQPDDFITGYSSSPDIALDDVAGDYPVKSATDLSTVSQKSVIYLYIASSVIKMSDLNAKVTEIGEGKIKKFYLVRNFNSSFPVFQLARQVISLRKMLGRGVKIPSPIFYSNGGKKVMTMKLLPLNRSLYLERPVIYCIKSYLKYFLQFAGAINDLKFVVFDLSECLNY
jgi:hypothetical protein